ERFGLLRPYVLSLCHIHPRKNLPRLVRAWNRIAGRVPHQLVLVGKQGWGNEELNQAISGASPGHEPVFTGYVADGDLPFLYAAADLFVYPSLYEGFGLPPLEAMACGTPVLTSSVSSLPEVVGDAALLVNPYDEGALARALEELLADSARRRQLSEAGLNRAAGFSWERCARATIQVYREVAQNL
ncbi:MAG: glycosyltransferase family 4 protein, partial [Armatimonadetes bacterium]|nr:glycosyltransferase family 4 protein [Armatimonadota bacterium]